MLFFKALWLLMMQTVKWPSFGPRLLYLCCLASSQWPVPTLPLCATAPGAVDTSQPPGTHQHSGLDEERMNEMLDTRSVETQSSGQPQPSPCQLQMALGLFCWPEAGTLL